MAINSLKQYFVSMEEEKVMEGEDFLDSDFVEVGESYDEVEETADDLEELTEADAGLNSIVESLEASLEHGGLDPVAAQFASHAVAAYTNRLGIENTVPSLESFGGDAGRVSATTVSMEGIKETLQRIWAAIKAAVEKSIRAVRDFFAKLFSGVDKVISKAEELEKKIKEKSDKGAVVEAKAKIKVPQPNTLGMAGSASAKNVMGGLKNLQGHNSAVFGSTLEAAKKKMSDLVSSFTESDEEKIEKKATSALEAANNTYVKQESKSLASGNKTIVATKRENSTLGTVVSLSYTTDARAKAVSGDTEIAPLSYAEMTAVIAIVKDIMKNTKDKKKSIEDLTKAREEAVKDLKKVVDDSERSKVGGFWVKAKGQAIMRMVQMDDARAIHQVAAWNFSVSRAALSLVSTSLAKFKETNSDS